MIKKKKLSIIIVIVIIVIISIVILVFTQLKILRMDCAIPTGSIQWLSYKAIKEKNIIFDSI